VWRNIGTLNTVQTSLSLDKINFKKRYVIDHEGYQGYETCWRHIWYLYINKNKQTDFLIVSTTRYNDGFWIFNTKANNYTHRFDSLYLAKNYVLVQTYG
jgi:hypothetical protein